MEKIFERFRDEVQKEYTKNQDMLEQVMLRKQEELTKQNETITERDNELRSKNETITKLNKTIEDLKNER